MTRAGDRRLSVQHPTKPFLPTLHPTPTAFHHSDDNQLDQDNPAYPAAVPYHHLFVPGRLSTRLWHYCLPCRPATPPTLHQPHPTTATRLSNRFHQVCAAYPEHPRRRRIGRPKPARPVFPKGENPYHALALRESVVGEIEAKDGLPSADRNNKATLLLTGPFRTAKSSAKDLTPLVLKLQYAKYHNHSSVAVEESPAKTLSRSLFLSICTCGWYHRVLAWILT